jgi:phosphopantetheinyl transferase
VLPIHVRWIPVEQFDRGEIEHLMPCLAESERTRARSFAFDRERAAYVAAHVLTRHMLGSMVHADAAALRFARAMSGKPILARAGAPPFSLSHGRSLAACATGYANAVGIDVEDIVPEMPGRMLLEQTCTRVERAQLAGIAPDDVPGAFTQLWTIKEAVLKGCGDVVAHSPLDVECDLETLRVVRAPAVPASGTWQLFSRRVMPHAWLTVAAKSSSGVTVDARAVAVDELRSTRRVSAFG